MTSSDKIIVREYLSSLKEDKELDYLFPILLNLMGFRIIQTAKDSKGQPQYGKDIIAVGNDENGIKYKWYFELKGYSDRNITSSNYKKDDGIRDSIIASIDTQFTDNSIPNFDKLPVKVVIVHNGIIDSNTRRTLDGFVERYFDNKKYFFERWDIYYLTDLFSQYLFSEYLLTDDESSRLFKRTLALLDSPDYDLSDFKQLINIQFDKIERIKGRAFSKLFSTLNLISSIIYTYCKENNNLLPAKKGSSFLVLKTWSWVLKNKIETKNPIKKAFNKLLEIQYSIYKEYIEKTLPVAILENGLFAENGASFEEIGYPLRSFEYISDLIYYYKQKLYYSEKEQYERIKNEQKDIIIELIENNSGFQRPVIDSHSIEILQIFLFFADKSILRQKDIEFIAGYIFNVITGIFKIELTRSRLPELYSNINLLVEYSSTKERPEEYVDNSSVLMAVLVELLVVLDSKESYINFRERIKDTNLIIVYPHFDKFEIEKLMFEKHMHNEYYNEVITPLPDDFDKFKEVIKAKINIQPNFRTDNTEFSFLKTLAHSYYRNEIFPCEWRILIDDDNE